MNDSRPGGKRFQWLALLVAVLAVAALVWLALGSSRSPPIFRFEGLVGPTAPTVVGAAVATP